MARSLTLHSQVTRNARQAPNTPARPPVREREAENMSTAAARTNTTTQNGRPTAAAARQALQDKVNEQEKELERFKAQLAQEVAARKEAEQRVAAGALSRSTDQVEKPAGTAGEKGFSLIAEMMLEDEKEHYLAIQRTVRDLCHAARLDWTRLYREQPPRDLGNLFEVARKQHPHLNCFRNNWATAELVKQYLRNRRKYARRRNHFTDRGATGQASRAATAGNSAEASGSELPAAE
ncbi:hypothetical protein BDN67DRAFT_1016865 [Paxillus ammoniavirescens]|nr:hypothetical protein BDN67DRAFT_1016865 [Paxillus ammoniavirescens]